MWAGRWLLCWIRRRSLTEGTDLLHPAGLRPSEREESPVTVWLQGFFFPVTVGTPSEEQGRSAEYRSGGNLFDGFFADWMVLDRIQQSRRQVQETKSQIRSTLDYLRTLADQTAGERTDVRRRIQELVDSVPM